MTEMKGEGMTGNLRVFGLVAVAALAMSAIAAPMASATVTPFWFRSDAAAGVSTIIESQQEAGTENIFAFDAGEMHCTETNLSGSQVGGTVTTLTLRPSYQGCIFRSPLPIEIYLNHCGYLFHTDNRTEQGTPGGKFDVEVELECENANEDMTITQISGGVLKCTIHIEQQTLGTGIVLTNAGESATNTEDITADVTFNNIKYTQTEGTGFGKCATTTTTSNGTWTGKETITGKNLNGQQTNIWVE
jgi:hypothetical protein